MLPHAGTWEIERAGKGLKRIACCCSMSRIQHFHQTFATCLLDREIVDIDEVRKLQHGKDGQS